MARPIKKGLDYFNMDVSFYRDIKLRKLIRRKDGKALSVYVVLLAIIYEDGYYINYDEDLPFVLSEILGYEEDTISDVISYCIEVGLFDKQLYEQYNILTSHGIQERYVMVHTQCKHKYRIENTYCLLNTGISSEKTSVSSEETHIDSEETISKHDTNDDNSEKTSVSSEFSTESKVKESKDNNSLRSSLSPSSTPSSASTREVLCVEREESDDINPMTAREGVELLKNDSAWLLQMQRKFGMDAQLLFRWLDSFVVDCDCRGKQEHESLSDVKQHFNDWMTKMKSSNSGRKKSGKQVIQSDTPQQRWNRCYAELCHSVGDEIAKKSFAVVSFESFDTKTCNLYIRVPSREVYEYMEQNLVRTMNTILPKYFGNNVKLQYHLS